MRHHSITWQDGNFANTASVLSFDSRAARAAYPAHCPQRVEPINYRTMRQHLADGRPHWLALYDASAAPMLNV